MDIDLHLDGSWHECASIALRDPAQTSRRGGVTLRYDADYALQNLNARDFRALSVRAPVDLGIRTLPQWPSFLIDLLPQGAARKRLERGLESSLSEWSLLERGAVTAEHGHRCARLRERCGDGATDAAPAAGDERMCGTR